MKYKIFFDESKKIDRESKYSYYGAISIEEDKLNHIETQIENILKELKSESELHFVDYRASKITHYFQVLDFFLSCSSIKFNIYRLNNNQYLDLGESLAFSETDLRKYFYVKIPERLFYGLVRDDGEIDGLDIVMDDSTEYQTLGVFEKISDQMNAHSLYRSKSYHVNSVTGVDSKNSRMIQMLDVVLGIVVYLLEKTYLLPSNISRLNKQDLIYRILIHEDNLSKFHQMVSIFTWDNMSLKVINKVEISDVTSHFLLACNKIDFDNMLPVQEFYASHQNFLKTLDDDDRLTRINLLKEHLSNPYSPENILNNSLVELFLGHLCQIEFKDRNRYLKQVPK